MTGLGRFSLLTCPFHGQYSLLISILCSSRTGTLCTGHAWAFPHPKRRFTNHYLVHLPLFQDWPPLQQGALLPGAAAWTKPPHGEFSNSLRTSSSQICPSRDNGVTESFSLNGYQSKSISPGLIGLKFEPFPLGVKALGYSTGHTCMRTNQI